MTKYYTKEQVMTAMGEQNLMLDDIWGVEQRLDELSVTDVAPVIHGHWKFCGEDGHGYGLWRCTYCGNVVSEKAAKYFCPFCGARMDGGENDV